MTLTPAVMGMAAEIDWIWTDLDFWFTSVPVIPDPNPFIWTEREREIEEVQTVLFMHAIEKI